MPKSLQITVVSGPLSAVRSQAVAAAFFRQVQPVGAAAALDQALDGALTRSIAEGRFEGRLGEVLILPTEGRIPSPYAVAVGLGDFRGMALDVMAPLAAALGLAITQLRLSRLATVLYGPELGLKTLPAVKRFLKNLVSALALVDPDGAFCELIICESDPARAAEIAEAVRGAAAVLRTRITIEVLERRPEDLPGRESAPLEAPVPVTPPLVPPSPFDPSPVYLDVSLHGQTLYYRVLDKKPTLQVYKRQVPAGLLEGLPVEMLRLAGEASDRPAAQIHTELQAMGVLAFNQLLSAPMRERLRSLPNSPLVMVLDQGTVAIPWELLHDKQEFLCRRFPLARRVIMEGIAVAPQSAPPTKPLRMLLVADPTGDLPGAREECSRLARAFREGTDFNVKLLEGDQATPSGLLAELGSGRYHVVHYAGHAEFNADRPEKSAWILAGGDVTAAQIGALDRAPGVVFANACDSGTVLEWGGKYRYDDRVYGLASAFLRAGVNNYIGTFWPVHDEASAHFATTFYTEALYGAALGQAMQAAREAVIRRFGWNELTWAGYMLYGDPTFCLAE